MTAIFHNAQINKEQLKEIILKNPQTLLGGLSFIDLQMATDEAGTIDFLGVNIGGRIVLVNFDINSNDNMLIEVLAQIQWLKKNEGLIKRLFFSENVNFEESPQVILVCPAFSPKLQAAVRQLSDKEIKLLSFKYIVSKSDDAIIFDEVFSNLKSTFSPETESPVSVRQQNKKNDHAALLKQPVIKNDVSAALEKPKVEVAPSYDVITLTPEEIAEFMDFDVALEQGKSAD